MSKLLYNLHSLCLTQAETNRLDAFHVRCLRRILKIAPSFYSRVPNKDVMQVAGAESASHMLLERQLLWMGGLAARPDDHVLRKSIFKSGLDRFELQLPEGRKKRGRPKLHWASQVYKHALHAAGNKAMLQQMWQSTPQVEWKRCVQQYCHA